MLNWALIHIYPLVYDETYFFISINKNSKILFYNSKKFNLHNVLFHYFTHSFDLFATQKGENRVKKSKYCLQNDR